MLNWTNSLILLALVAVLGVNLFRQVNGETHLLEWLDRTLASDRAAVPGGRSQTTPTVKDAGSGSGVPNPRGRGVDLADLSETTRRPLFSPDRRPPESEVEAKPVVATVNLPPIVLSGVVTADGNRYAIFRQSRRNSDVMRLAEGDTYEGWKLVKIERGRVTFEANGKQAVLEMDFNRLTPPPRKPAPRPVQKTTGDKAPANDKTKPPAKPKSN